MIRGSNRQGSPNPYNIGVNSPKMNSGLQICYANMNKSDKLLALVSCYFTRAYSNPCVALLKSVYISLTMMWLLHICLGRVIT